MSPKGRKRAAGGRAAKPKRATAPKRAAASRRAAKPKRAASPRQQTPHGAAAASAGCAILTVSDTRGAREDASGDLAARRIEAAGHRVRGRDWVPDEPAAIRRALRALLARRDVDAVIVTGGTGVAPRDRTPEAVRPLLELDLPGFGELFRMLSFQEIGTAAWLSRAGAGVARGRVVVYLPGSPKAVDLALTGVLLPELRHLLLLLGRLPGSA